MKIDVSKLRALIKSRGLTNTDLAARAGITREGLQGILRAPQVIEIRDRTVKGLVEALKLADESLLSPDPLAGYKKAVAAESADLSFAGLGLPTLHPKSMDDIYIPVKVAIVHERNHEDKCSSLIDHDEDAVEFDAVDVDECLALHRRVLICGEPGSGKTTALRHAARQNAQGFAHGGLPLQARIPLMVRLADFAKARERDTEMTLVRFAVTRALPDALPDYSFQLEREIDRELRRGGCMILLDGLDEVAAGASGLLPFLRSFIDDFGQNHFVLTSRIVGLDPEPWRNLKFATFRVIPWQDGEIQEFTHRWYAAWPMVGKKQKKQLEQRAEELTTLIMSHRPLRAIAANPLMLTILAGLHYANAALPRRRVDLYAKIVEVMLETWEANKRGARPGDPLHGIVLEAREFGWLLGRVALQMQREERILRPRWWVNDCVQQFLREDLATVEVNVIKEQSDRIIRYLCERTGLLVERGDGMFGFGHRTFQEYFAARGLLLDAEGGGDIIAILRPHLFHPQWEEVVIYVAASLSPQRATTLVRILLDDPDPAGRFLRRGQRLALRGLVDGAAIADRDVLNQVFSEGETIGKSRWLGIPIEFTVLLKQLLVTRHESEARQMLSQMEDAAKKELPANDYFTLYLSSHDPPSPPTEDIPGTICRKCLGGRRVELIWPALRKRIEDPQAWHRQALARVRNSKFDIQCRKALISWLGAEADTSGKARNALKRLLENDPLPAIRTASAEALEEAAASSTDVAQLLMRRLDEDESDEVRSSCAMALSRVVPKEARARTRLENLFTSGSETIRAGAARGLSRLDLAAPKQKALLQHFLDTIASTDQPSSVRCACIWAVASALGQKEVADVVGKCLDDARPTVKIPALHIMADAITEGTVSWSPSLVKKIETMLMAVVAPCHHLFHDLVALVAMKEIHGHRRLDRLLGDALEALDDHIQIAFVFGSVARLEQVAESDIDLMIIGDVRLKDLAVALHPAEQTLGRPVNPVLFLAEKFREEYRQGNPLLHDVVRKEKIFLKGSRDELTKLVADGVSGSA